MNYSDLEVFKWSGSETHDASQDATSDILTLCNNWEWEILPDLTGLDGSPTYSIEVSENQTNWYPYRSETEDAAIDQPFRDDKSVGDYYRIVYKAVDNTAGTVRFPIKLKKA